MEAKQKSELGEELWEACCKNQRQKVETLIDKHLAEHPDPSSSTLLSTVMVQAATHNAADVVAFALERGAPVTDQVMSGIASSGAFNAHRVLIEAKAIDIDYFIPWFGDILGLAARKNNLEWAKFCLEHGANPNLNMVDEYKTVLAAVAEDGNREVADLLVKHGAWVRGSGAIVLAGEAGKTEMVRFLLDNGADINEVGVEDPTDDRSDGDVGSALHKAIENGHVDTALLLIESGADVSLKNARGQTARDLAEKCGQTEVLEAIEQSSQLKD